MQRLLFHFLFCLALILTWAHESADAKPSTAVQIAIVRDGPSDLVPELRDLIRKEIVELTDREFEVRFPDEWQLQGGWSVKGVNQAIDRVLTQPRVDLVIALGILASHEVSQRRQLPKPVIAPFVIDPHLQGLPFKKGASGVKNLNYLVSLKNFERNLEAFQEVFPFTRLSLLADRVLLEAFPLLESRARTLAESHGVSLTVVPVETSAEAILDLLPQKTDAVYLSPLPRLPAHELGASGCGAERPGIERSGFELRGPTVPSPILGKALEGLLMIPILGGGFKSLEELKWIINTNVIGGIEWSMEGSTPPVSGLAELLSRLQSIRAVLCAENRGLGVRAVSRTLNFGIRRQ